MEHLQYGSGCSPKTDHPILSNAHMYCMPWGMLTSPRLRVITPRPGVTSLSSSSSCATVLLHDVKLATYLSEALFFLPYTKWDLQYFYYLDSLRGSAGKSIWEPFLRNKKEYKYKVFLDSALEIFPTGLYLIETNKADWQWYQTITTFGCLSICLLPHQASHSEDASKASLLPSNSALAYCSHLIVNHQHIAPLIKLSPEDSAH
jgi:hypothetical protein